MGCFDGIDTTDTGSDGDTYAMSIIPAIGQPRIFDRLDSGRHSVLDEWIYSPDFLAVEVLRRIEVLHRRADLHAEIGDIETLDPIRTTHSLE